MIALSRSELQRNRVILRAELADDLPPGHGRSGPASAGHPEPAPERLGRDERRRRSSAAVGDQNRTRGRRSRAPDRAGCGRGLRASGRGSSSSKRSTPPRAAAWGSACPSVAPSSRAIMAVCGPRRMMARAPRFHFPFRGDSRVRRMRASLERHLQPGATDTQDVMRNP